MMPQALAADLLPLAPAAGRRICVAGEAAAAILEQMV